MGQYVGITGLPQAIRRLGKVKGPALERTVRGVMTGVARSRIVPAMKAEAPKRTSSSFMKGGTRGGLRPPGYLRRSITARRGPRRFRDISVVVGPRAWYRHFVIKGTKPHSLAKRGSGHEGPLHPGSRANPFVNRAAKHVHEMRRVLARELTR